MDFIVRPAKPQDAYSLAPRLRKSDVNEIKAASGSTPEAALVDSFEVSDPDMIWSAERYGQVEVMFGANDINGEVGGIWMLGSDAIYQNPRNFLKHCNEYLDVMHTRYPYLTNFVSVKHRAALRWIMKLGFVAVQFIPEYGSGRQPFIQFVSFRSALCANQ